MKDFWIYLLILAGSTYLIRAIPFAVLKKKITNPYVRSFLYYIPYISEGFHHLQRCHRTP